MKPVQLFCWHFMAYPYLAKDFDEKENSGWVTVTNRLWDKNKASGLYQAYLYQQCVEGAYTGAILEGAAVERALLDQRRVVRARRPLFPPAQRESLAQADAKTLPADVDPRLAQSIDDNGSCQARLLLFSFV